MTKPLSSVTLSWMYAVRSCERPAGKRWPVSAAASARTVSVAPALTEASVRARLMPDRRIFEQLNPRDGVSIRREAAHTR